MGAMASQITSLTIVYSIVYSGADQTEHQRSASLAFVRGIHRRPVNSPHKGPVTLKMFPFDDVIMVIVPHPSVHCSTTSNWSQWRRHQILWAGAGPPAGQHRRSAPRCQWGTGYFRHNSPGTASPSGSRLEHRDSYCFPHYWLSMEEGTSIYRLIPLTMGQWCEFWCFRCCWRQQTVERTVELAVTCAASRCRWQLYLYINVTFVDSPTSFQSVTGLHNFWPSHWYMTTFYDFFYKHIHYSILNGSVSYPEMAFISVNLVQFEC